MEKSFQILVDRIKGGRVEKISESYDPSFLEIQEKDLAFHSPVKVKGEAYTTDTELVIHFKASTLATMPCAICNEMLEVALEITDFYHTEELKEIQGAIFDFRESLREALLIELPKIIECNGGKCPQRKIVDAYLGPQVKAEKTTHFPFADL